MVGPKKQTPLPIDRPLSRAYLRNFTGWSTAYPPGLSDPTSCRQMENMMVSRDKGLSVRPGLRYLSYSDTPDADVDGQTKPGFAIDRPLVGDLEPFYLANGSKALLFAVRETDDTVGFRAMLLEDSARIVYELTDQKVGFYCPQGIETLRFSSATKHVRYLQIDNKVFACSDAGESIRLFMVGGEKIAKRLNSITQPEWSDDHKLTVVHPSQAWILKLPYITYRNELLNPSFQSGMAHWSKSEHCDWDIRSQITPVSGTSELAVWSVPQRHNLVPSPLHNVSNTGIHGWTADIGDPKLSKDGDDLKLVDDKGTNVFLARTRKMDGIDAGKKYHLAYEYSLSADSEARARLQFYRSNGSEIGEPVKFFPKEKSGRYVSPAVEAPQGAVSARVYLGADSTKKTSSWVKVRKVLLCRANEPTDFFSGASGDHYYWSGTANDAPSMYWPPVDITISSDVTPIRPAPGLSVTSSIHVAKIYGADKTVTFRVVLLDKDRHELAVRTATGTAHGAWERLSEVVSPIPDGCVAVKVEATIHQVGIFEWYALDAGMVESAASKLNPYFDGSTPSLPQAVYSWEGAPHRSVSLKTVPTNPYDIPFKGGPNEAQLSDKTLIAAGGDTANKYKMAFFYTFENEIGESAASKMTEVRIMRPPSNWLWETPTAEAEPSGTATDIADSCADQLVAYMPQSIYDSALAQGAIKWNLYVLAWSDQDPVPVVGLRSASIDIYPDATARLQNTPLPYVRGGWANVTPSRKVGMDDAPLPTAANRVNYSKPPRARNGLVAGDRIILVGDADEPGTIRWTSNRPGEYTKFTANKGGGVKTLSSGNLNLPSSVMLWQNPQSVDTLTILCLGSDGTSTCYYMAPAELTAQSSTTAVMGFEETTNTPGTMAPYGALVHNNALFRPIDRALLKSTAQNYNINHKSMTDDISNMWEELLDKRWIMAAAHDNRLYYLVNNPRGVPVEDGCHGNEIWVHDMAGGETGTWSRFLIHASALRVVDYGSRVYIGVIRPDGLYYLDPNARQDDYVAADGQVLQRPIPWYFEMNTQGANKAHDAWAHLHQLMVTVGNFIGTMEYGIRAKTINGSPLNLVKRFSDDRGSDVAGLSWEAQDFLAVRRDLMEWFFYARSVEGVPSSGQFNTVQYRYTPVSVNVGYEYGSVETFEYARNVARGNDALYRNGIPEPAQDFGRM